MAKKLPPQKDFLSALIRKSYLPRRELPPIITSKYFAEYCKNEWKSLFSQKKLLSGLSTNFETFSVPQPNRSRRPFAIVHPLGQLAVSISITENRVKIISHLKNQKLQSLYETESDISQALAFKGLNFSRKSAMISTLSSRHNFILKADVSRFFYTIYTHSIPWAILGKAKAKKQFAAFKLKKHWSSSLDTALQVCHSRETFGIPVGPDTSRLVAEILLAGVLADPSLANTSIAATSFRLMDDFYLGFDDAKSAANAQSRLRDALWAFNLQLNDQKTKIILASELHEEEWRLSFDGMKLAHSSYKEQRKDIYKITDWTLINCKASESWHPAHWTCSRLSNAKIRQENLYVLLECLLRLSRHYPSCVHHVCTFIINNQNLFQQQHVEAISSWLESMLEEHYGQQHDFEVTWILMMHGILKIPVSKMFLDNLSSIPNPSTLTLLLLLQSRGLVKGSLAKLKWRQQVKKSGPLGHYWLPAYEAVMRKWTTDNKIIAAVKSNAILNSMLQKGVTFLEDDIFSAKHLNIKNNTYSKPKTIAAPKPSVKTAQHALGPSFATIKPFVDEDDYD